jgi:protein-S-isoprenylcysteine O-methyltransferase Ste14
MPANPVLRYRVPLGFLFAAWYLWLAHSVVHPPLVLCTVMVGAGCALRSWAAGYLLKGKRVAVGGPYAFVRNPLYVGSFILGAGFCAALYQNPLPAGVLAFWIIYILGFVGMYVAKGKSEEAELTLALGPEYLTYRQQVPAFLPLRGKVHGLGEQHFSRELYKRNREYQCIVGCVSVLAFLFWIKQHGF